MGKRGKATGIKCDLADVAKQMVDIVTGKAAPASPAIENVEKGASDELRDKGETLSAKRTRSLLVQIKAAKGDGQTDES